VTLVRGTIVKAYYAGPCRCENSGECGLHRTYVSGVERGVRNPTVVVLERIAKALKVATSLLLEERGGSRK